MIIRRFLGFAFEKDSPGRTFFIIHRRFDTAWSRCGFRREAPEEEQRLMGNNWVMLWMSKTAPKRKEKYYFFAFCGFFILLGVNSSCFLFGGERQERENYFYSVLSQWCSRCRGWAKETKPKIVNNPLSAFPSLPVEMSWRPFLRN